MKSLKIKIVGQSGSGLLTVGELFSQALQEAGFYLCSDREYPSLIKGGHSCYTIHLSSRPVHSLSRKADVLLAIDKHSLGAYYSLLEEGGILIHGYERIAGIKDILESLKQRGVKIVDVPARTIALEKGGNVLMTNMILLGLAWKCLGWDEEILRKKVEKKFASKKGILPIVLACFDEGVKRARPQIKIDLPKDKKPLLRLDGNHALALGAMQAGVRFYVAYPMSPASSILSHLALDGPKIGMVIKQAEDEITAAQMALGAMTVGTRAFTATSGGGFDLMSETVSLAGILESPFVVVLAQRPGPGTGLPTWTAQGDLHLALHAGHGEFARVILGVSAPDDAFLLLQKAFDIAEKYQVPVFVLTEKVVAESKMTIKPFPQTKKPLERGLLSEKELLNVQSTDRYKITESGVSPRWLPGQKAPHYFANGDEHGERGELDESEKAGEMYAKRNRKLQTLAQDLPEPVLYGPKKADMTFVGWGSSRAIMQDVVKEYEKKKKTINYLHYEYVWPLKTKKAREVFSENKNFHGIENNYGGQFLGLFEEALEEKLKGKLLKWNGRPFFQEEVRDYINKNLSL